MCTRLRLAVFLFPAAAALLLGCGHAARPSTAAGAAGAEASPANASGNVVGIVHGLELAGREDKLFRQGLLTSNLIVLDTGRSQLFIHSDTMPEVGGRRIQLGDLVSFAAPRSAPGDELSRLESFRFLNAAGTAPDARLLSGYSFVPQYLRIMPPDFFPPVPAPPGIQAVNAVVVGLALAAREETLSSGEGLVSNLVVLDLDVPAGSGRSIITYTYALPTIASRRVQLGDVLSFVPTANDDAGDFNQLAGLRFQE